MEANMQVLEGVQRRLRVKLTNEAGVVLPPGNFRVYGGAFCPGCAPAHFAAERTEEEWVLTMPGLKPGRVPWCWQVLAAEYATGVEWVLAGGEVTVFPRVASGAGGVDPGELELLATLDKTTLELSVTVGESTAACSMAAGDARACALAADGSAKLAADSARLAEAARDGAEAAQGGAEVARDGALAAMAGAEGARDGALAARSGAEGARDGAQVAQAGAGAAREGAQVAQAGAAAAQVAAEDAAGVAEGFAQRAAGAACEAVLAAAEAKAAEAGAAGAADAVRFDLLPLTLEWLEGRLEKMYGAGMCSLALAADEGSLRVAFSLDMGAPQVEEAGALLDRVLPRNLVTEMYWADGFPVNYTRLEYLESTGTQWMITDFVPNNESGVRARYINNSGNGTYPIITVETVGGAKCGFSVATMRNISTMTCVWGRKQDPSGYTASTTALIVGQTNYLNSRTVTWYDQETNYWLQNRIVTEATYPNYPSPLSYTPTVPFHFCKDLWYGNSTNFRGKLLEARFSQGEQDACIFVPALDDTGVPCMYDLLARKAFRNKGSGQFIAGVETQQQLDDVLRGLPNLSGQDGGELHLRLSDTLYEAAVASGIIEAAATAKNWQIAYDPTTETAA